jgi:hypothetical protein
MQSNAILLTIFLFGNTGFFFFNIVSILFIYLLAVLEWAGFKLQSS